MKTAPTGALATTSRERLFLNRFGTGFTQQALTKLRAAGSPEAWLEAQLAPANVPEAAKIADIDTWFSHLERTPAEKAATNAGTGKRAWEYGHDFGELEHPAPGLLRAVRARDHDRVLVQPAAHPRRPRPRLGLPARLRRHHPPAGARYATRTCSSRARCTPRCVPTSTTGSRRRTSPTRTRVASSSSCTPSVVPRATPRRWSRPRRCCCPATRSTGEGPTTQARPRTRTPPVRCEVLDFQHPNAAADGQAATVAYLKYLANHPATARPDRHQARDARLGLAPDPRVDPLAGVYPSSGTDIPRGAEGAVDPPGVPDLRGPEGAHADRRPGGKRRRALDVHVQAPDAGARANTANYIHGGDRVLLLAPPGRPAAHRCPLVGRLARVQQLRHAPEHGRRLVAEGSSELPLEPHGCPRRPCDSTRTSTTCAAPGLVEPPTNACSRPLSRRSPDLRVGRSSPSRPPSRATTHCRAGCSRGWSAPCSTPPTT